VTSRRTFLKVTSSLAAAALLPEGRASAASAFPTVRIPASQRAFRSEAVEALIREVQAACSPELGWLFGNCFPNTLDTTVRFQ